MHGDQLNLRVLYEALAEGPDQLPELLEGFVVDAPEDVAFFQGLAVAPHPERALPIEANWRLYALSRVCDRVITLRAEGGDWGPWRTFMEALGFRPLPPRPFHPALHEVVDVVGTGPWTRREARWPGWLLGDVVFCREGVTADVPADVDPETLTRSTLGWAVRRPHRPTWDASFGWGSNSQWRTTYRRDVVRGGRVFYDVDALDAADPRVPGIVDIIRFRCRLRPGGGPLEDVLEVGRWDEPVDFR